MTRPLVIGYDGSPEARHAVDFAARTLRCDSALVVNVIHDQAVGLMPASMAGTPPPMPSGEHEAELERAGRAVAAEGADRARAAGLDATSVTRRGGGAGDVARVLLDVADECDGALIVVGHRHASRLESALLGSVSVSAVREERRPVLVVPA
jgi:nucleotide-binding universal stress UspA family protein